MSVAISARGTLLAGRPTKIFDTIIDTTLGSFGNTHFAATPDGQRFLVNSTPSTAPPLMIVQNWAAPSANAK